jgi:hypothetical protein
MSITPIGVTNPEEHPRRPDGTRYEWTDWKKLYYAEREHTLHLEKLIEEYRQTKRD